MAVPRINPEDRHLAISLNKERAKERCNGVGHQQETLANMLEYNSLY